MLYSKILKVIINKNENFILQRQKIGQHLIVLQSEAIHGIHYDWTPQLDLVHESVHLKQSLQPISGC